MLTQKIVLWEANNKEFWKNRFQNIQDPKEPPPGCRRKTFQQTFQQGLKICVTFPIKTCCDKVEPLKMDATIIGKRRYGKSKMNKQSYCTSRISMMMGQKSTPKATSSESKSKLFGGSCRSFAQRLLFRDGANPRCAQNDY
jgi:hypothetical protein